MNRLKKPLKANAKYCVKYLIVCTNNCVSAIDSYGALACGEGIDTINFCSAPIINCVPSVHTPTGTFYTDTLNWMVVSGTFTANGSEKYLVLGNFRSNAATNTLLINPFLLPGNSNDIYIDDVTLVEIGQDDFAGRDTSIAPGDSLYLGGPSDEMINRDVVWYELPGMNPIDTIAGLWVKPAVTTSYVVRWNVCNIYRYDTVVVSPDLTSIGRRHFRADQILVSPVPAKDNLEIRLLSSRLTDGRIHATFLNSMGIMVREEKIGRGITAINLDTSTLPAGFYFLHLTNERGNTVVKRVIIAE